MLVNLIAILIAFPCYHSLMCDKNMDYLLRFPAYKQTFSNEFFRTYMP